MGFLDGVDFEELDGVRQNELVDDLDSVARGAYGGEPDHGSWQAKRVLQLQRLAKRMNEKKEQDWSQCSDIEFLVCETQIARLERSAEPIPR